MFNISKIKKCNKCSHQILTGTVYVQAMDKTSILSKYQNFAFHPNCFKCTSCEIFLTDLAYCMHNQKPYCMRHYGNLFHQRCGICDEVCIFFLILAFFFKN